MIKKLMWAIVIVLLVSLIMSTVPWSKKIDVKLRGVQSRVGESSEVKEVTVTVKGTYNKYFVKNDTFKGTISISTYGDIWDNSKGELVFSDNTSIMTYINMDGDKVVSGTFGSILCATDFSEVLILVNEQYSLGGSGWTNENGVFISAPAKDREQAIEIADKLGKRTIWLSEAIWK